MNDPRNLDPGWAPPVPWFRGWVTRCTANGMPVWRARAVASRLRQMHHWRPDLNSREVLRICLRDTMLIQRGEP